MLGMEALLSQTGNSKIFFLQKKKKVNPLVNTTKAAQH